MEETIAVLGTVSCAKFYQNTAKRLRADARSYRNYLLLTTVKNKRTFFWNFSRNAKTNTTIDQYIHRI